MMLGVHCALQEAAGKIAAAAPTLLGRRTAKTAASWPRAPGDTSLVRRWLAVPLAAFAATAAAGIPLVLAILALGGDESFARLGQSAVGPFAFVSGGALAAPAHRLRVALGLLAFLVAIVAISVVVRSDEVGAMAGAIVLYSVLGLLSGGLALALIARRR